MKRHNLNRGGRIVGLKNSLLECLESLEGRRKCINATDTVTPTRGHSRAHCFISGLIHKGKLASGRPFT